MNQKTAKNVERSSLKKQDLSAINLDPVVAHLGAEKDAVVGREDNVGGLVGKMTVDTFPSESAPALWK